MNPELSLIIPCCDESDVLPLLKGRLLSCLKQLSLTWEVIFVDDGSRDSTFEELAAMHGEEPRFKVIALSRNFGHQAAISAGLSYATGAIVGIMDADLQDPPELLGQCLDKLGEGYDVVYGVRCKRKEGLAKRATFHLFYRLLKSLADIEVPLDAGDFCVMNRRVAEALKQMPERNIFLRGMRAWTGFRQVGIEYERGRRVAGKTKYPLAKLLRLAADGIFSLSTWPLRVATWLGLAVLLLSAGMGTLTLVWRIWGFRLMGHTAAELPGWTTLAGGMFFFSGVQLLLLGCIGEYIGRIYTEVKSRPRWIVREAVGINDAGGDREV